MLLAKQLLTERDYNKALKNGVTVFLYNELNFIPEPKEGISLVNCTTERVASTWFTWDKNQEVIESFKVKFPQFFQWGKFDFSLSIKKALFWSNMRIGYLEYIRNQLFKSCNIEKGSDRMFFFKEWKVALKYFKFRLQHKTSRHNIDLKKNKGNWGILIEDSFQFDLYKHVLIQSTCCKNVVVFIFCNKIKDELVEMGFEAEQIVSLTDLDYISIPLPRINLFKMADKDWYVLDQIVNNWKELNYWHNISESIIKKGISKLLINEGENGVKGAVLGEVMRKNNIECYNTMNGMKSGQAQDAFQSFHYWFIWGIGMKKMMMDKCSLPESMLLDVGHLMEDEIANYTFQNSIPIKDYENKKVISLFSVRGKREEKLMAFQYLYDLLSNKEDLILLIRKHPSEKEEDFILPENTLANVHWIEYTADNSKTTLYDQLFISSLSICFGSTVALESKWFGVPCITYEMRDESLIYMADNIHIHHVRDFDSFSNQVNLLINSHEKRKPTLNKVSQKIVSILNQNE